MIEFPGEGPYKSVCSNSKGAKALDSDNEKDNMWDLANLEALQNSDKTTFLKETLEILKTW